MVDLHHSKQLNEFVCYKTKKLDVIKAEFQNAVYECRKCMCFHCQLGQTKVVFNSQGKNAPQYIAFSLEIILFKIEITCGKKL